MAGISSKAAGTVQNKEKTFQGQRFDDDLGLNWIQFKWRNHDVQIGRFIEIDPLANDYVHNSTYAFSENKVTSHIELEGLESVSLKDINTNPYVLAFAQKNVQDNIKSMNRNGSEALTVKGILGIGLGGHIKAGKTEFKAIASGPQGELTATSGGDISGKASAASVSGKAITTFGNMNAEIDLAVVRFDGKFNAEYVTGEMGVTSELSKKQEIKDDNKTSGNIKANFVDGTIAVGLQLGIVGLSVSANVIKAGAATVDAFCAFGNWLNNVLKEKTTIPKNSNQQTP